MRSRKRRFTGHQFCPPPYRAKMRLHCKHYGQINWQFTFADSLRLPRHARACPMRAHTCTLPLWCRRRLARQRSNSKLPQLRQERRRRYGGKSRSTCWLDGGDLVVPVSSPIRAAVPGATPRGRLASDSARPSQRATPRGRLASNYARPSRERLRAAVPGATPRGRPPSERLRAAVYYTLNLPSGKSCCGSFGWEPADLRTCTVNISEIYLPCLNLPKLICYTLKISKYI
jgi:hypothetical protein